MKKANNTPPEQENPRMPLTRRNYILLAVGFAVILLGFVLMAGGGSDSPDEFNYAMFSWRRRFRHRDLRHHETLQKIIRTAVPAPGLRRPVPAEARRAPAPGPPVRRDGTGDIPA